MAITKRQVFIGVGISVIVAAGIYIVVNKRRNEKLIKQINDILDKGTQATGTPEDIKADDAFDPAFYKKYQRQHGSVSLVKAELAKSMAKRIYDDIGNVYDNETDIVAAIKQIKTKTRLSFVSEKFLEKYGESLGSFITEHVDKGDNLETIQRVVSNMPEN